MLETFIYLAVALVVVISIHEAAHAFVAYKLGDDTAKHQGRLTLNPMAHLDPIGTLMIFIAHFGWGKPVPVNPYNFKDPVKDSALVSLAGPASNFATALLCSIPLKYFGGAMPLAVSNILWTITDLSILLGIFNLLPFPPLDGSKIFAVFVPKKYHARYFTFMQQSQIYFVAFLLIDIVLIRRYLGYSLVWSVLINVFDFVKILIFLGG
ncbi:site-2 protease family protein [Candidatus Peregrinibacteria bacterium]|nr:site-2 protease family protein [Candidatus Peregrinibacteria bacterium]